MSSTDLERAGDPEEDASVAFAVEREIKQAIRKGREALWELAEALYEFDERHGWMHLGYDSLGDWLADPDITMTMGTYRRYVRVWRKLVIEKRVEGRRLLQLDPTKVDVVADKIARNEVLVDDALADVEAMGARDLREKYYNRRPSNVGQGQHPANTPEGDSGRVLPDEDAPTRADELDVATLRDEVEDEDFALAEPEPEILHGEVVDDEPAIELPDWVTVGALQKSVADLREAVGSGATWPRVERRSLQVALEVAQAWLAIQAR